MSLNEEIQMSLLVFLKNAKISDCEFGQIKEKFLNNNPQYQKNNYYHYLYRALQNLCKEGYMSIDKSKSPFKYSSNLTQHVKDNNLISELKVEMGKINFSIYSLNCDLFWYEKYKDRFPNISKEINLDIEDANKKLHSMYSKKKVLKRIMTHLMN